MQSTMSSESILNMWNNFLTAKHAVFNLGRFFFFFPVQMIINLQTQKLCTCCFFYEFIAYSIVNGAYNELTGVNLTIFATRCDSPSDPW